MLATLTQTLRHNAIALLALVLAAGGSYALAASHSTTIHGCVVKKTGVDSSSSPSAGADRLS